MKELEKLIMEGIMAILPIYLKLKGNSTKIITEKEEIHVYKNTRTVLRTLAKFYTVDLNACRQYYGALIGSKNVVPIPLNSENILIPIKVRKPISRNDGSFGYVNLKYVKELKREIDGVSIVLVGDLKIKCIQSIKSVEKHIRDGKVVKKMYEARNNFSVMERNADFYMEYNKPATKGDIAVLRSELLDIKNRLDG